jgi:hypothetical protein
MKRFDYGYFDTLWAVHPVGNKKLAYDQAIKLELSPHDMDEIGAYLKRRQKYDKRWQEGKVHHLRTILSQRHWEAENYERIRTPAPQHVEFEQTPPKGPPTPEERRRAREALMATGLLH